METGEIYPRQILYKFTPCSISRHKLRETSFMQANKKMCMAPKTVWAWTQFLI